ncbi:hypothetical protein B566_EDAN017985 [Ephemera danica]|nr:hypothetical protein B566_EDAN017985 [Ephemera danica]
MNMAWRFKASKYKNATPILPKPEACVRDIVVGSYQSYGNNIASSAAFMACIVEQNGSNLAVLPVNDSGRKSKDMPLLHAHSDTVTDMAFSPFHDDLLVTGSQDCLVKLWHIPENGLEENLSEPECTFSHSQKRVETVTFHPTTDFLLTTSSYRTIKLWDLICEKEIYSSCEHGDVIQSLSWNYIGSSVATTCKDRQIRVLDPRTDKVTHCANGHQGLKESRVVWLGDQTRVLSTGFDSSRLREVIVRDIRNFKDPLKILQLDCSTGILIPLFDMDTNMLFLAGKGDRTISYMEVTNQEPFFIEGIRHSGEQTKGACLVPKRALSVMQAEVNRVLQLTSSSVIPIMYQVPRKSYRDFHDDLYPDTNGPISLLVPNQWMAGENKTVPKISLDPSKTTLNKVLVGNLQQMKRQAMAKSEERTKEVKTEIEIRHKVTPERNGSDLKSSASNRVNTCSQTPPKPLPRHSIGSIFEVNDKPDKMEQPDVIPPQPTARSKPVPTIKEASNPYANKVFKPRLGPKPFSPPCLDRNTINSEGIVTARSVFEKTENSDTSDSQQPTENESDAEGEDASERKAEEDDVEENNSQNGDDKPASEEEESLQSISIAERRKLYEKRSMSTPVDTSPANLHEQNVKGKNDGMDDKKLSNIKKDANLSEQKTGSPGPVSKFKHLKGTYSPKSTHIQNIRNISQQLPKECDGFQGNPVRVAVPLSGPGGRIAVLELMNTGKLPDVMLPVLVHGANVLDFAWDPFDFSRLAVVCEDCTIRLWNIPENGLTEQSSTADVSISSDTEKLTFIKFHPLARDVVATGSSDLTIRVWDLKEQKSCLCLEGHDDQIFSFAWSPCGNYFATMSRDTKLRVFEPRKEVKPINEGVATKGLRGARVVWALDGSMIIVSGFDKTSERQLLAFKTKDLKNPLTTIGIDTSPAILIPFYDEDSSTLFLTGKGDSTIFVYEVREEAPYLCPLSHHRLDGLHQGLSFLPKNVCDVANVEFARALRLTNSTIHQISYTVPRVKSEFFQDDLFPSTKVTWEPTMEAKEWFEGKNKMPRRISLKPDDMPLLSENQSNNETVVVNNPAVMGRFGWQAEMADSVKKKQEEIIQSVSARMEINLSLAQDDMDGVDENEWDG